ncbi:homocysteine S-methyltransferase family protein [Noviherbaspirillum malthae]|uniref:homocysteine S-methyltransferase family protein n=1 Tax=Noviherbaspirillum malthae TaxID=1260987 RepID=UPI00188F1308|nr:homocysteine S-methyltransferase family protein [Noviherbaspirillum malthae]
MSKYRSRLPQVDGEQLFMTDGGLETTLIFHEGVSLPYFAAFDLLKDADGTQLLEQYYRRYIGIALQHGVGLVLEAPTWRANRDWASLLGYGTEELADANRKAISMLLRMRAENESPTSPMVISGNLGPRGDGFRADAKMNAADAQRYHAEQIETFARTDADMVAAFTMNYAEEAIGIVHAAKACAMPVAISFTVETDGKLPSGESLRSAIERTDDDTGGYAAYHMINCAHPLHFQNTLHDEGAWLRRIRGIRANASQLSHAELDEASELDDGNPEELGKLYGKIRTALPAMNVVGGCCGTDHRHVDAICRNLAPG